MNEPVSPLNPKAEPVLYALALRLMLLVATRFGIALTEANAGEALTLLMAVFASTEAAVSWIVRHRVTPVHSSGAPVALKGK